MKNDVFYEVTDKLHSKPGVAKKAGIGGIAVQPCSFQS